MNTSIKLPTPCELINITPVNPLISKCQIKVCWVGEEANRNRSIITKETARQLANSLPGSPIVGFYNEETKDFEQHNRAISIKDGKFQLKDTTRPYGFVDLGAKVWFQKFSDNGVEHEYMMTEGYLWTGQYPECQRIIDKGNNQSMELDDKILDATWTKDANGNKQFFIINEGIISKLCILGEDYEPCFEGAQITKVQYSFEDSFKEQLFSLMNEIKTMLSEGGASMTTEFEAKKPEEEKDEETCPECGKPLAECECEEEKEKKFSAETEEEEEVPTVEEEVPTEETPAEEFAAKTCPKCGKPVDECECEDEKEDDEEDKKDKYVLDEIPEYVELRDKYAALENDYNEVVAARDALQSANAELTEFKASIEKKEKQAMIDSFYMLSDEDKKDVNDNIDIYSLDDIEAKLSIICVRNKVSFNLDDDKEDNDSNPTTYNLNSGDQEETLVPAWVKAIQSNAK